MKHPEKPLNAVDGMEVLKGWLLQVSRNLPWVGASHRE
jgi:hypothetical protein